MANDHLRVLIALPAAVAYLACWFITPLIQGKPVLSLVETTVSWIPVTIFILCILAVLARMDVICQVQQLKAQAESFRRQDEQVKARKARMHDFYSHTQNIVDLWTKRTLPRLELLKEMQYKLLAVEPDLLLSQMRDVTERIQDIEVPLGGISSWIKAAEEGGEEARGHQKAFPERVSKLLRQRTRQELENVDSGVPATSVGVLIRGVDTEFAEELGKRHSLLGNTAASGSAPGGGDGAQVVASSSSEDPNKLPGLDSFLRSKGNTAASGSAPGGGDGAQVEDPNKLPGLDSFLRST